MGVEIFFPQRTGAEISHWLKFGIQCLNHSNSSWGKDSVGLVLQGMAGVPAKKKKEWPVFPKKKGMAVDRCRCLSMIHARSHESSQYFLFQVNLRFRSAS